MRALIGCIGALAGLLLSSAAEARDVCAFPSPPRVIEQSGAAHAQGGRLLQVWEVEDHPVWWSQAKPAGYPAFEAKVAAKVGETDPLRLLAQNPWANNRLVAEHAADWIRPINCLEMLLQQKQDQRMDTLTSPTEFMAIVLRSADTKRLRVYFYTANQDGVGRTSPVSDLALVDRRAGWNVLAALHNHAFHPGTPSLNGPVAPSKADARFNVNYAASAGMAEAWITNGLHTARIPAAAFGQFERDPP